MNTATQHHFELNSTINNIVGNTLIDTECFDTTIEIIKRQYKLIDSEFMEMVDGIAAADINEIRDGLGDVIVTVDGMYCRLGLEYPQYQLWMEKDFSHPETMIDSILADLTILHELSKAESYGESKGFFLHRVKVQCDAILWAVYQLGQIWDVDLNADQVAIYESNMSKFDTDIEVARRGVAKYEALGVKTSLFTNKVNGLTYYVIKCTEDCVGTDGKKYGVGKFLKSVLFKEPKLAPLPPEAALLHLFTDSVEA